MLQEVIVNGRPASRPRNDIRVAGNSDAVNAMGLIMLAFSSDPVARWVYPEPADYLRYFPSFIKAFAGNAFERGMALTTPDFSGAALWLGPGVHSDDETLEALVQNSTTPEVRKDLLQVMEAMETYHPDEPHWYLPMIGVDPRQQNRGIGSDLMKHALDRCDAEGLPAYLESSNPRNISLYERYGFVSLGSIQFGASQPLYPMVRWPQ